MTEPKRNELPGKPNARELTDGAERVPRGPSPLDDDAWEAFVPDDDQCDPLPEPGDFWIEREG